MPEKSKEIRFSRVLAVEGKDEVNFFSKLLQDMGINEVDIHEVNGKNNFKTHLQLLTHSPGFFSVTTIAIVRDADNDIQATFQSMRDILKQLKLPFPDSPGEYSNSKQLQIGIFLMPDNKTLGMLEDLCLKTVKTHPVMGCVEKFAECVSQLENPPKIMSKAKAHVFLAAMPDLVTNVGLGAQRGYWNLKSQEMKELHYFLEKLRNT
jgi:hypothetical protein